ncbi:MAG: 50S ribosomal protein L13 [Candidatus Micrarchaeota archaeon]
MMIVINAKGQIAGRLSARIAKFLLAGEEVAVIEAQDSVLSGTLQAHIARMHLRRTQKDKRDPEKSPKYPKLPHLLFRRMVRGMLPKKSQRGRDALHLFRAYTGTPAALAGEKAVSYPELSKADSLRKKITLGQLCKVFGYEERI